MVTTSANLLRLTSPTLASLTSNTFTSIYTVPAIAWKLIVAELSLTRNFWWTPAIQIDVTQTTNVFVNGKSVKLSSAWAWETFTVTGRWIILESWDTIEILNSTSMANVVLYIQWELIA